MSEYLELSSEDILNRDLLLKFLSQRAGEELTGEPIIPSIASAQKLVLNSLIDIYIAGGCSYRLIRERKEYDGPALREDYLLGVEPELPTPGDKPKRVIPHPRYTSLLDEQF